MFKQEDIKQEDIKHENLDGQDSAEWIIKIVLYWIFHRWKKWSYIRLETQVV